MAVSLSAELVIVADIRMRARAYRARDRGEGIPINASVFHLLRTHSTEFVCNFFSSCDAGEESTAGYAESLDAARRLY